MNHLYPLLLQPLFYERVWGGRGLEAYYGPQVPAGTIGEAWVMGEHPHGTNRVTNGPLAGTDLGQLRREFGAALLGSRGMESPTGRLPLLIKLLDAQADLSVQVHPADDYEGLPPGEPGKAEMWHILAAEPGASIIYGLQPEIDAPGFAAAVRAGRVAECLRRVEVQAGESYYIPPGTVHTLGAGVLAAEVQQSSDTVYRLYDYDRPGLDGRPRALQIDDALRVTRCGLTPEPIRPAQSGPNLWQPLVHCPYFSVERGESHEAWLQRTAPVSFEAVLVLAGQGAVQWDGGREALQPGSSLLVPAELGYYELQGDLTVLRARMGPPAG